MTIIRTGMAVVCFVVIMVQCVSVAGEEETVFNRLRFFLLSYLLSQSTNTTTNSTTPSVNNSNNTFLSILNSTNTMGIAITPRLRISREMEAPEGVAFLEFLDDRGEPIRAAEVPDTYYEILMNIMQTFNKQIGVTPKVWPSAEEAEDENISSE